MGAGLVESAGFTVSWVACLLLCFLSLLPLEIPFFIFFATNLLITLYHPSWPVTNDAALVITWLTGLMAQVKVGNCGLSFVRKYLDYTRTSYRKGLQWWKMGWMSRGPDFYISTLIAGEFFQEDKSDS